MNQKILLLGIDAFDPEIVRSLIDQGKLQNFQKLFFQPLQTSLPPETPVAWSAAATGCNPGRYGIYDFLTRNPENYLPKLNLAHEKPGLIKTSYQSAMQGEPFWRTLTNAGVPVSVVRWPVTFPAEKVKGNMLAGLGVVDIRGSMNSYTCYTEDEGLLELDGQEKVVLLKKEGEVFNTELAGPQVRKRGELRKIGVPLTITVNKDAAVLSLPDQELTLKEGEWSEIIRVKFKVLPLLDIYGICNLHLVSLNPFQLYLSSVQIDPANQAVPLTAPEEYGRELADQLGLFYTLGMAEDTKAVTEGKLPEPAFLEQVKQIEGEREKMFWYEFDRFKEGVLAFIFDAGDRLSHIFWRDKEQGISEEMEEYYLDKDRLLGEILEKLDSDTKLLVLSDHGFTNFKRQVNINSWLVEQGYMQLKSKEETELFHQVDWSKTSAYSLGFTSIFLNRMGREKHGIVSDEEATQLTQEISEKLLALRDGENQVFTRVYPADEVYRGRCLAEAPDMIVGFQPGYRMAWRSAVGGVDPETISDNESPWRGDHLVDPSHVPGVLFTNFEITAQQPSLIDIAPTVLQLMGVTPQHDIDGVPLL